MKIPLRELSLSLAHQVEIGELPDGLGNVFLLRFEGKPGYGSEGNLDAIYISSIIRTIAEGCMPDSIIVDFTKVDYEFGNGMMKALDLKDGYGVPCFPEDLPCAIIGNKSRNPIYRVCKFLGMKVDENPTFLNQDEAVAFIRKRLAKRAEQAHAANRLPAE